MSIVILIFYDKNINKNYDFKFAFQDKQCDNIIEKTFVTGDNVNYSEFYASLKKIQHVYLLAGAESYYVDRGINDILTRLLPNESDRNECLIKMDGEKISDLNEITAAVETAPFFSEKNVILVKNTTLFKSKSNAADDSEEVNDIDKSKKSTKSKTKSKDTKMERLINAIQNIIDTNYLIFTTRDNADKRKPLYKAIASVGVTLEAEPLRHWQIDKWLDFNLKQLGKGMEASARSYFIEIISMLPEISLNYLYNELNKTALYSSSKFITKSDLQTIMAQSPEVSSFALNDAINEKNLKKASYLLSSQINEGKEAIVIALLARHVRLLIRAKNFMRQGVKGLSLGKPLGLNPYVAQKTGEASKKFSDKVLEDALVMIADADYFYKSGKSGSELLERIVVKLIRNT